MTSVTRTVSDRLATVPAGRVHRPGTPGYDAACAGFDLAAVPAPDVAVSATGEDDVVAALRAAVAHGLPVAVRATGHGPVPGDHSGVLVDTRAMSAVTVDPARRTATVGAGATWTPVLAAAAPLGLAPLCGSAPDVGAVSYTLGGGLGPLGRRYGWAADHVRRVRLVTASGELLQVTADSDPDLFWALRGGGGNFGIVTELEMDLVPVRGGEDLYGGGLYLPGAAAPELLAAFGRCTASAPDELGLSVAFVTFPDLDAVPPPLRGQFAAHLRVAHLGTPAEAEALIAPLRAVAAPLLDTVRPLQLTEIGTIHADPVRPQPVSCGSAVLPRWDDAAAEVLLGATGPAVPHMLEVRHLGGALARAAAPDNAVGHRDARYSVFTSAYPGPALDAAAARQTDLYRRLLPWSGGRSLYNFTARPDGRAADARSAFDAAGYARLAAVKAVWDPANTFQVNVNVPPAPSAEGAGRSRPPLPERARV
jgi:hypothetical protein